MSQNIFPGLRAMIALELQQNYNLNQSDIAKKLFVSQPAISQYTRQLRGGKNRKIFESPEVKEAVKKACQRINEGLTKEQLDEEFCKICKIIRNNMKCPMLL